MASKTLNTLTLGTSIAGTDHLIGYTNTALGGERRWTVNTLSTTLSQTLSSATARAWVIFNGTATSSPFTVANGGIEAAYNVTSITDNGVGEWTINFAPGTMTNTRYAVIGTVMDTTQNYVGGILYVGPTSTRTVSQCQIAATAVTGPPWAFDSPRVQVVFYGGN